MCSGYRRFGTALVVLLGACATEPKAEPKVLVVDERHSSAEVVGVLPELFECASVAPDDEVRAIIGPFRVLDSSFDTPDGLAKPCNYLGKTDAGMAQWSFDLDCRKSALDDGKKLMVQYATSEQSAPVRVGESGIDYKDAALLFIDDDTPCYGRILGPGAETRRRLGELIASRLTPRTAPTSLRYQRGTTAAR